MNVNNRIATLDAIFQELKATHPTPAYLSKRKYKLSDAEREHIEAMLTETGLVEVIEEPYALTKFRLNNKGLIELKKHGSYSDFLASLKPASYHIAPNNNKSKTINQYLGSFIASNIWKIILALIIGFLMYKLGLN